MHYYNNFVHALFQVLHLYRCNVCVYVCVCACLCVCVRAHVHTCLLVCRLEGCVGVRARWRERVERGGQESTCQCVCAHAL